MLSYWHRAIKYNSVSLNVRRGRDAADKSIKNGFPTLLQGTRYVSQDTYDESSQVRGKSNL